MASEAYRRVVEIYLGRPLKPEEEVHHINENHQDTRVENLIVFMNHESHMAWHSMRASSRKLTGYTRKGNPKYKYSSHDYTEFYGPRKPSGHPDLTYGIVLFGPNFRRKRQERLDYFKEKMKRDLGLLSNAN